MVKILISVLAALVIAVAGYFGFEFYVQQRITNDVEAAFADVRASGAQASHGKVHFDLWSRTITVADIAGQSATQPPIQSIDAEWHASPRKDRRVRPLERRQRRRQRPVQLPGAQRRFQDRQRLIRHAFASRAKI